MKRTLLASLALAATLAGFGCDKSAPKARRGATRERLSRVEVVTPKMQPLARRLEVAATVEAMKSVDISARIPGIVRDLDDDMTIERVVKENEILLKLDVPELVAEQATKSALAEQARKQEKLSEAALAVAEREVEESESDKKKFEADVAYTKLRYESARQLVRDNAQNPLVADQVAVNHSKADITPRQKAMLDFAIKVCLHSDAIGDADYSALRKFGFDNEDIWDITAITGFFGLSNRMANVISMRPNDEFFLMGRVPRI